MNPMMFLSTSGGYAFGTGGGISVSAQSLNGMGSGFLSGVPGSQSFSFRNGPLDFDFNSLGKQYSLRPDFISKLNMGKSWSVYNNGQNLGWVGFNPTTNSCAFSGGLGSGLGSGMTASLASSGAL